MKDRNEINSQDAIELISPLSGKVVALPDVQDEVFSQKILGDGIAVCPTVGRLCAPEDGQVVQVFESKHAITLTTVGGAEILLHIGIDTVSLKGKYFDVKVSAGQTVHSGDVLVAFDIEGIRSAGYDVTTPMIVSNSDEFEQSVVQDGEVTVGTPLLRLVRKKGSEGGV